MKINKIIRILTVAVFLCIVASLPYSVSAATIFGSMEDNTIGTANEMNMGDRIRGSITETDDLDHYKFQLDDAGRIGLDITSYMQYYCIIMYDSDGKEIWYTDKNEWIESVGYRRDSYALYLEKGVYYMQINGYLYGSYGKSTGEYECSTSFISSETNNMEPDNSFADANDILLGNMITGQISVTDDHDTFRFKLSDSGCVILNMKSYMQYYCIKLFNLDGKEIWYTHENVWTESVGYRQDSHNLYLDKGTYYMQINGYQHGTYGKSTGKYILSTQFQSSNVSFEEDDNSFLSANPILWNTRYRGQISINDDLDTYKFEVTSNKTIAVNITSYMRYYCIIIFNTSGERIWSTDWNEWNNNVGYRTDVHNIVLSAGTYYMQINGYEFNSYNKSMGRYIFNIGGLNQKNCSHRYTDKTVSATYFRKGYDLHKCEQCGKSYKDNYKAKKILGQSSISTWSKGGKKKLSLQWYTVSDASGYHIRYCTNKDMRKNVKIITVNGQQKHRKTIKNLSRHKKYYVQVRAYKKSGATTVYGKWSHKKYLRTK